MKIHSLLKDLIYKTNNILTADVCLGEISTNRKNNRVIFFPCNPNTLSCGLAGIVSYKKGETTAIQVDTKKLLKQLAEIEKKVFSSIKNKDMDFQKNYLGGELTVNNFLEQTRDLNSDGMFTDIFYSETTFQSLADIASRIDTLINTEKESLNAHAGSLKPVDVDIISVRIEKLMDISWCLVNEVSSNIVKVKELINPAFGQPSPETIEIFKKINTVLNAIDRLEVRGRDSAGISLIFTLQKEEFEIFRENLNNETIYGQVKSRTNKDVLLNHGISIFDSVSESGEKVVSISLAYKIAAEIGSLGDNVKSLRHRIMADQILQFLVTHTHINHTVSSHTRWASVGAISESNCHPVDNESAGCRIEKSGIIHVCLNGDIDNHITLKEEYEDRWDKLQPEITTDTKVIPMQIEKHLKDGFSIEEAFRKSVNNFEGSHAISMHTDLAPGKLFLAQKGSGQAIFIGIAKDHFMSASEVYGFVEETPWFLKMDGEKIVEGIDGETQGQIFILDQSIKNKNSESKVSGIKAFYYDGSPIVLSDKDLKHTEITSRDIDRQNFTHYFLKEITESPVSVEKTIQNRWKLKKTDDKDVYVTALDETVVPHFLITAFKKKQIKRIFFVGQGTAGVAALACSSILTHYINDKDIQVNALKASEFSGFMMKDSDGPDSMTDTLVIAISQSGTTTDTNLTVDMVRERGAHTLAIVNRRDSDLSFKVNGVIYTSSGRDIEMSVASTKAFYSQIVAGAILGLHIASVTGNRDETFVSDEIKQLIQLPKIMRKVLELKKDIEQSAREHAITKTYWAAVGSGSNKASADEIRIKLSELCYKTISSDFVEDKKHIDLSSEPLIIICAAGTRESVLGDIIKDTAIFHAHKALPIVIANEGEERFNPYAKSVFNVPAVEEHFAPIVNTLAGHIWGYYAALSINDGSRFIYNHRDEIQNTIDDYAEKGLNVYEIFLENKFREKITEFYNEFRKKRREKSIPSVIGFNTASDLTLVLKYLAGKLPVSDFEMDFAIKGTPLNMLDALFNYMNDSIDSMARPIDAIKHQAKTVTVGTSRISEKMEGLLFEALKENKIKLSQLTSSNILVLRNLQGVISGINGTVMYKINNLSILGKATPKTTINVIKKDGIFESIPSRVESDNSLKGTKSIIVREGNVFIGKGLKDNKNILTIPLLSSSSNAIEYILSFNVYFKEGKVPLFNKIKALGGKHERIGNIIQEDGIKWDDKLIELVNIDDLFGLSAEKIGEIIINKANGTSE